MLVISTEFIALHTAVRVILKEPDSHTAITKDVATVKTFELTWVPVVAQ
jgi:hypothetical protein